MAAWSPAVMGAFTHHLFFVSAGDCLVTGYDPPEGVTVIQDSDLTDGTGQRDGTPLLTQPRGFVFVWMDEHTREDQRLCIWKAVPMPG